MKNRLVVVSVGERERKRVGYDYRRDVEGILVMGLFCIDCGGGVTWICTEPNTCTHECM